MDPAHPTPTKAAPDLFTSGSYGVDLKDSSDTGTARLPPTDGWCILQCVLDTVLGAETLFGADSSGGSKLIGPTLPAGTYVWITVAQIAVTSGLVALYRGKHQS